MKYDLNLLCKEQFKQEGQKRKRKERLLTHVHPKTLHFLIFVPFKFSIICFGYKLHFIYVLVSKFKREKIKLLENEGDKRI
jgi:hypothetical protein